MDKASVSDWLGRYLQAWYTYDPEQIAGLFSENAHYYLAPYTEPIVGREAIVAKWLANMDEPNTYKAHYSPVVVDGDTAVANGHSTYYEKDGTTEIRQFDNIFVMRFDSEGRCTEFREWYMRRPEKETPE